MDGSDITVQVGGDVHRSQIASGNYNVIVGGPMIASTVNVVPSGERPTPRRRERVSLLPRRAAMPRGRDRELADLAAAIDAAEPLQVHGTEGIGKSTLVRHAARQAAGRADGVVFVSGAERNTEDVVQDVFEACFDCDGYRPTTIEVRRLMAGIGVLVVIDDLECPADDLDMLLDQIPDAAVLIASTTQSLWGHGRVLPLRGLGREEGRALLADALDRPLGSADAAAADALWEATQGNPLHLLRAAAAAAAAAAAGELPAPGQIPSLLPGVLERLSDGQRAVISLLATAGTAMSTGLLGFLLPESGPLSGLVEELASLGLLALSDEGCRVASDVADALPREPGAHPLADLAARLTVWVSAPERAPEEVAAHSPLIAAVADAAVQAGQPREGARLAAATAPAAALSLRWGAWQRVLSSGKAAAEASDDQRLVAYFTHEDGIRSLLTGKRAAAAAALGIAAALWTRLGDTGLTATAEHAQGLCGLEPVPHIVTSETPAGAPAAATKTGLGLTGKLVIGGTLTGLIAIGAYATTEAALPETVPVQVTIMTAAVQAEAPGRTVGRCDRTAGTACTTVIKLRKGREHPIEGRMGRPTAASFLYWGCRQPAPATSCTVRADHGKTICISTTSPQDESARRACAALFGTEPPTTSGPSQTPDTSRPSPTETPTPAPTTAPTPQATPDIAGTYTLKRTVRQCQGFATCDTRPMRIEIDCSAGKCAFISSDGWTERHSLTVDGDTMKASGPDGTFNYCNNDVHRPGHIELTLTVTSWRRGNDGIRRPRELNGLLTTSSPAYRDCPAGKAEWNLTTSAGTTTQKPGIDPPSQSPCQNTPSRQDCDEKDPVASGCDQDAITVPGGRATGSLHGTEFTVELLWSPTCRTNWSRARPTGDRSADFAPWIEPDRGDATRFFALTDTRNGWIHSPMAYSDNKTKAAAACVRVPGSQQPYYLCTTMLTHDGHRA